MLSPLRTTLRASLRTRCYSTPAAAPAATSSTGNAAANASKASAFNEEREAIRHHAAKSGALWRKITCVSVSHSVCTRGREEGGGRRGTGVRREGSYAVFWLSGHEWRVVGRSEEEGVLEERGETGGCTGE